MFKMDVAHFFAFVCIENGKAFVSLMLCVGLSFHLFIFFSLFGRVAGGGKICKACCFC